MVRSPPSEGCLGRSNAPPAFVGCISGLAGSPRQSGDASEGAQKLKGGIEYRRKRTWPIAEVPVLRIVDDKAVSRVDDKDLGRASIGVALKSAFQYRRYASLRLPLVA